MKQKRKVKSLISFKSESNAFLTTLLFLLGGVLCFGAVSLFTSSVGVEASDESGDLTYEGIDDQVEVIFDLSFAPEDDLGNAVTNMYLTTGGTFYMSGNVVNSSYNNNIDGRVYLLGGEKMTIASDNITLIGGRNNNVEEGNPNTAILGGEGNTLLMGNNKTAAALLGGNGNTIGRNQEGSAIIGGSNNVIGDNVVNSYILGGESNTIAAGSKNVIVGGKEVNIDTALSDVFVFSDGGGFSPKGSNAFYLDVAKGLGLGMAAAGGGVKSAGPVSFGDVSGKPCTTDDIGVQGTIDGCLVGCTQAGVNSGYKWELIDHGDICEQTCQNSTDCIVYVQVPEPKPDYTSQCTYGNVDTGHSTMCGSGLLEKYKNVFFETSLIDSDALCPNPNDKEDKCIFRCDPNYHLTGDVTGKGDGTKCYADCVLPWDSTQIYKHNQTVTGYNVKDANCSNAVGTHDTCEKHRATLICNNGEWWVTDSNGKAKTKNTSYYEPVCMLHQYRCDPLVYNLSRQNILDPDYIKDSLTDWEWANTDRRNSNYNNVKRATRGIYEVCIDYNPVPTAPTTENGKSCTDIDPRHYKLIGCQEGYSTGTSHPYECRKKCDFDGKNGKNGYPDGTQMSGYREEFVTCPDVCDSALLTCHDGQWAGDYATYKEDKCEVKDYSCPRDEYKVSQATYNEHHTTSIYTGCEDLSQNGRFACVSSGMVYKLIGCVGNRHAYTLATLQYCVPNNDSVLCDPDIELKEGEEPDRQWVNIHWEGGWNYGNWSSPDKCEPKCKSGYHGEPPSCEKDCGEEKCVGYNLASESDCPEGRICSNCRKMNTECVLGDLVWKPDRCDTANGWVSDGAGGCKKDTPPVTPTYSCTGNEPGSYTKRSPNTPSSDKAWEYVENTSATLSACQWSCQDSTYERDGSSMNCKKKGGGGGTGSSASCTGNEPGSYTKRSPNTPSSDKAWEYVENTSATLSACQWTCQDSTYKRDGTSMNCKPKESGDYSCGGAPNSCGDEVTPTGTGPAVDNEYDWYCGTLECGMCTDGTPVPSGSLHNGYCASGGGKVDGKCSTQTINGCIYGTSKEQNSSNYVYTWECEGSNGGTTDHCRVNCNIKCGSVWNSCEDTDTPPTWSLVGSNQELVNINANGVGRWGWRCNTSSTKPAACNSANSNFVNGGYSVGSNECGCDTKSCDDYASYGYHDERYGGQSYQQWPVGIGLPSGCFGNEGNGGHITCYRARHTLGGTIVGVDDKAEGLGYGEDIYGNKNVVCGCEFNPSSWGGDVEDITSLTVNFCARGKSVNGYNACKDPISAGCATSTMLKHNGEYGKTFSIDVNTSPYEDPHVVKVTLGTPTCCETYKCIQNGKPSNSHYINVDDDVCYSAQLCDWECNSGYRKDGNKCVSNTSTCPLNLTFTYGGSRSDGDGERSAHLLLVTSRVGSAYYSFLNNSTYLEAGQSKDVTITVDDDKAGELVLQWEPVAWVGGIRVVKGGTEYVDNITYGTGCQNIYNNGHIDFY